MQSPLSNVTGMAGDLLKSFIVMAMKTMFRRGASGGQIREFLALYMPEQETLYNGDKVIVALEDLARDGTIERRGIRWCRVLCHLAKRRRTWHWFSVALPCGPLPSTSNNSKRESCRHGWPRPTLTICRRGKNSRQ